MTCLRVAVATTLGVIVLMGTAVGPANAAEVTSVGSQSEENPVSISAVMEEGILWVDTGVGSGAEGKLSVKIYAPSQRAGHNLWQRCEFSLSGAGTYRCGLDAGAEALAPRGKWIARAYMDGIFAASAKFRPGKYTGKEYR